MPCSPPKLLENLLFDKEGYWVEAIRAIIKQVFVQFWGWIGHIFIKNNIKIKLCISDIRIKELAHRAPKKSFGPTASKSNKSVHRRLSQVTSLKFLSVTKFQLISEFLKLIPLPCVLIRSVWMKIYHFSVF